MESSPGSFRARLGGHMLKRDKGHLFGTRWVTFHGAQDFRTFNFPVKVYTKNAERRISGTNCMENGNNIFMEGFLAFHVEIFV